MKKLFLLLALSMPVFGNGDMVESAYQCKQALDAANFDKDIIFWNKREPVGVCCFEPMCKKPFCYLELKVEVLFGVYEKKICKVNSEGIATLHDPFERD